MNKLMDTIQVDRTHDWEVRHLCYDCEFVIRYREAASNVGNLGVADQPATTARARFGQNCNTPAGVRSPESGLGRIVIYQIAVGKPRDLTSKESKYLASLVERMDKACQQRKETVYKRAVDCLLGLMVPRYDTLLELNRYRAWSLVPMDLRQLVEDLDSIFTNGAPF